MSIALQEKHCVKSVRSRSFSGPYFPAFGLNTGKSIRMWENTDEKKSEYGHFSRSESINSFMHNVETWLSIL